MRIYLSLSDIHLDRLDDWHQFKSAVCVILNFIFDSFLENNIVKFTERMGLWFNVADRFQTWFSYYISEKSPYVDRKEYNTKENDGTKNRKI